MVKWYINYSSLLWLQQREQERIFFCFDVRPSFNWMVLQKCSIFVLPLQKITPRRRRRREDQHGLSWGLRECRLNDLTHMWRCVVAHDMTWLLSLHNGPCTSHLLTTFEVRPLLKAQDHYSCQDKDDQLSHKSQSKSSVKDGGPGGRTGRTYRT